MKRLLFLLVFSLSYLILNVSSEIFLLWPLNLPNNNVINKLNQPLNLMNQPLNLMNQPLNLVNQPLNRLSQPLNRLSQPLNRLSQPLNRLNQPLNRLNRSKQPLNVLNLPLYQLNRSNIASLTRPVQLPSQQLLVRVQPNYRMQIPKREVNHRKNIIARMGKQQIILPVANGNNLYWYSTGHWWQ